MITSSHRSKHNGITLVELVLVLVILTALAAIVVPLISKGFEISTPHGNKTAEQVATEQSMYHIRDAIMGTEDGPGLWADLGQRPDLFPRNPDYLLLEHGSLAAIPEYAGVAAFDPVSKIGWRGPYLVGHSNLIDAWGNDILIQVDFDENSVVESVEARYARLVSAGPDGVYDTVLADGIVPGDNVPTTEVSLDECGDDIVLFFRVADTRQ